MSYCIYEFNVELLVTFMFKYRKVIKSNKKMIKFLNSFALIALMAVVLINTNNVYAEDAVTDPVAEEIENVGETLKTAAVDAQAAATQAELAAANAVADAGLINTALEQANATKTSLENNLMAAQAILESDTTTIAEKAAAQAAQDTISDNLAAAQILIDTATDAKTNADADAATANNQAEAAQALANAATNTAADFYADMANAAANTTSATAQAALTTTNETLTNAQNNGDPELIALAEQAVASAQAAVQAAELRQQEAAQAREAAENGDITGAQTISDTVSSEDNVNAIINPAQIANDIANNVNQTLGNPLLQQTINNSNNAVSNASNITGAVVSGNLTAVNGVAGDVASASAGASGSVMTLGDVIDNTTLSIANLPQLINYFGYIMAIFFMGLSLFKFYSHVQYGPQQTPLIEPIKYFGITAFAAALPSTAQVLINSFDGFGETGQSINNNSGWADTATGTPGTLDTMMMALMQDIYMPMQILLTWFGYVAGFALLLIAIHRLTKTAQQGRQGPAGAGTLATFALAAVCLSFAPSIGVITESLFGGRESLTTVSFLAIDSSLGTEASKTHVRNVIVSVLVFLVIVGLLSMIRGFFILRGVAEGQQQATLMGGLSHVVAGAILVNFGQFANIVQNTLGIEGYGVLFN
jgi:hypothetical protein